MAQQEQRAGRCLQTLPAVASQNSQKHQLTYTLQASLGALFFSGAFVYTAIEAYLPQAFSTAPAALLSITFGAYTITQLAVTIALMLARALPAYSLLSPAHSYVISVAAFGVFTLSGIITAAFPYSLGAMLLQRTLLGFAAAVFAVHAYTGVARGFTAQDSLRAVACINAGLVAGDSVAPVVGNLVFGLAGSRITNAIQPVVCTAALLLISMVPASLKRAAVKTVRQQLPQKDVQVVVLGHHDSSSCSSSTLQCSGEREVAADGQSGLDSLTDTTPEKEPQLGLVTELKAVAGTDVTTYISDSPEGASDRAESATGHRQLQRSASVRQQLTRLAKCLRDGPLLAQMMVLVLTQFASSLASILMPQALVGQALWVVPTAFGVQAVFSIISPFITEAALARCSRLHTPTLLAVASMAFAASTGALLPMAATPQLAAVFICCAVSGAAYPTLEVLAFHHTQQITAAHGCELAVDVGAILYTFFYCAGNTLGGLFGGAIAHMSIHVPMYVTAGVSAAVGAYGIGLCLTMSLKH